MRIDSLLSFVPVGSPLSLVGSAGVNIASTNVIDFAGVGSGNAVTNIIGNAATFGEDPGIGRYKPAIEAVIGTALATSTSCTLNMALQLAPDNGSNAPGTWQTAAETGPITATQGAANTILRMDWPPAFPANEDARFARLLFQVPSGADFTAGTISYAIVTNVRDDASQKFAQRNYAVH